jgi:KDO2-lipid IV(A) lauroyltransferase
MKVDVQYNLIKAVSCLVSMLPHLLVCYIGRAIGFLFFLAAKRLRQRAVEQAMNALEISHKKARNVVQIEFCNLGQTLMEELYTPALLHEGIDKYVTIEGLHYLKTAFEEGHGVVILTAHMGNWEWMGAALAQTGLPITTIVKPQPNPSITRILNEYREMLGLEVFNRGSVELVKAARTLKQGKGLGFLADQDGDRNGIFVEFFGKMASTPAGPAAFAQKFNAAVVPVFAYHLPGGHHRVEVQSPLKYERCADSKQEIYLNTEKMTKTIEDFIRMHPSEWMWFIKRWNTPYKGQKD